MADAALAVRPGQDFWDERQLAVLHAAGISAGAPKAELAAFLHVCQRTGLDPFARQIYLIPRWDAKQQRELWTPQVSIDGLRLIARRACQKAKHALGYGDSLWCGDDGQWADVWLSPSPPAAAKVMVIRSGEPFSAVALWREYAPRNKAGELLAMWRKMPAGQLAKCAEALALRKACPQELSGVYAEEEMAQAGPEPGDWNPVVTRHGRVTRIQPWRAGPSPDDEWAVDNQPDMDAPDPGMVPEENSGRSSADSGHETAPGQGSITAQQSRAYHALFKRLGITDRDARLVETEKITGRLITTSSDLSEAEAAAVIRVLSGRATAREQQKGNDDA